MKFQLPKLESVKNIDVTNKTNLTIIVILCLVIFAIIYIWLAKINTTEGFGQYNVNSGDTVTLYGLDNVLVGSTNPLSFTSTLNSLIDARNATSVNNTYAKASDVAATNTSMATLQSNFSTLQSGLATLQTNFNTFKTSTVNSIESATTLQSAELQTAITNMKTNMNTTINNMLRSFNNTITIVGMINYAPVSDWSQYFDANNSNANYILGKDITTSQQIVIPVSNFSNSKLNSLGAVGGPITVSGYAGGSILCLFDWVNDNNIYYNTRNGSTNHVAIYTSVYPISTDQSGNLKSPFNKTTFIPGSTYLFNIYHSKFWNSQSAIFCVLFNNDGSTNVNLINKLYTNDGSNHVLSYNQYIITTTTNNVNLGIYVIATNGNGIKLDSNDQASISVYKLITNSSIPIATTQT